MNIARSPKPRHFTPLALACALLCGHAWAQIRTDGTVGAAQTLSGPAYQIPQALGRLSGANLFHSFSEFSVGAGQSATFTTSSPGIANVIGRVTGGSPSQIDGTLRLSAAAGAPALFFINPAGVAFGAGAQVDVPGAFHVATADYVKFADGRLYADPARASSFSSAPPEAFGFLGVQRGLLALQGGAVVTPGPGHGLTLAGGDVLVDASTAVVGRGGEMRIAAMGTQAGDVPFSGPLPAAGGVLAVRGGSTVATGAVDAAGGALRITAGDVLVDGGSALYSLAGTAPEETGVGGDIEIRASGTVSLSGGGNVTTETYGSGAAGAIRVQARDVLLDGEAYLFSNAAEGAAGRAGAIEVQASGRLALTGGASISTWAYGTGGAGAIALQAGEMGVDGGAYVQSEGVSGSSAITVAVAGGLTMGGDGRIVTVTSGAGDAGTVTVQAGTLQMDTKARIRSGTTDGDGSAGAVSVAVRGDAQLAGGSLIGSLSGASGNAGNVTVSAANLTLDRSAIDSGAAGSSHFGNSGDTTVQVTGTLSLHNESSINTSTLTNGRAGKVQLRATDIVLDGKSYVSSDALQDKDTDGNPVLTTGMAGALDVVASGKLVLGAGTWLSADSATIGDAGRVSVTAASIDLSGGASITASASESSIGRAGNLAVSTGGALTMRDTSFISAMSAGVGNAGNLQVQAGSVLMDSGSYMSTVSFEAVGAAGQIQVQAAGDITLRNGAAITTDAFGTGSAGGISVVGRNITLADGSQISSKTRSLVGEGGRVTVQASGELALLAGNGEDDPGSSISTSTFSQSNGGAIAISAGSLRMAGRRALISSSANELFGNAGNIDVQISGLASLADGAGISTSTVSAGNGGSVRVRAGELRMENLASISSSSLYFGNAGSVDVQASGDLVLRDAWLSSSTFGIGAAGSVQASAARILVQGSGASIAASELGGLSSQTGNVTVLASESIRISDGAQVSIANSGIVTDPQTRPPATLRLAAPSITMDNGLVTAAATGNVAASTVAIDTGRLLMTDSAIATSANAGNGGPIRVQAAGSVLLRRSGITTSVFGTSGDGGDIALATPVLVLETGFVQANTAARDASGGLVRIDAGSIVASGNTLLLGGDDPYPFRADLFGFNVVQAAAPTGVSGQVQVTSPVLDVTGSLRGLVAQVIDAGGLGRSLCQTSGGSSLAPGGRGGLAPSARGFLRAEREDAPPVAQGLAPVSLAGALAATRGCL